MIALAPSSQRATIVTGRHASRSVGRGIVRRARVLLVATWLAAVSGCVSPPATMDDAASPDAAVPGVPGTLELLPATTEAPELPVEGFTLRIRSIRFVGDRGPELDPGIDGTGLVSIGPTELEVPIGDVAPALYSAVLLTLGDATGEVDQPVLELQLALIHSQTLDIATLAPITLNARCEHGAVVNTTDAVSIGVDFALTDAVASVLEYDLPAADAHGVVRVDENTAPDAIAAFRRELAEHIHAECGPDTI